MQIKILIKSTARALLLPNGVWGTNPVWINTAKQVTTNGITTTSPADYYYYQNDHLGTAQQIIDSAGNIVWQQKATAFGETSITTPATPSTGAITNHLRFAGQYFDQETNTNYNYHRQYNPAIDIIDDEGNTPLHEAVMSYREAVARTLIKLGANVNYKNKLDQTPLDIANSAVYEPCIALLTLV